MYSPIYSSDWFHSTKKKYITSGRRKGKHFFVFLKNFLKIRQAFS